MCTNHCLWSITSMKLFWQQSRSLRLSYRPCVSSSYAGLIHCIASLKSQVHFTFCSTVTYTVLLCKLSEKKYRTN
jgi:hypothetical protein